MNFSKLNSNKQIDSILLGKNLVSKTWNNMYVVEKKTFFVFGIFIGALNLMLF